MESNPNSYILYAKNYAFFVSDLALKGVTKEVFAIIFGFWKQTRKPVKATYSTLKRITGANDLTISSAFRRLIVKGFIKVVEGKKGCANYYDVTIPANVLANFDSAQAKEREHHYSGPNYPSRANVPPDSNYTNAVYHEENTL